MVIGVQIVLRTRKCASRVGYLSKFLSNNGRNTAITDPQKRLISTTRVCLDNVASRKYTDKHEWITVVNNIGTVGISHYAQDALGDVVYAQLPDVGQEVTKDGECGALESVKAASDIYSPVTGKITEKNDEVENKPGFVNLSCYDKGWLFKVELTNPEEFDELMSEVEYQKFLKTTDS